MLQSDFATPVAQQNNSMCLHEIGMLHVGIHFASLHTLRDVDGLHPVGDVLGLGYDIAVLYQVVVVAHIHT